MFRKSAHVTRNSYFTLWMLVYEVFELIECCSPKQCIFFQRYGMIVVIRQTTLPDYMMQMGRALHIECVLEMIIYVIDRLSAMCTVKLFWLLHKNTSSASNNVCKTCLFSYLSIRLHIEIVSCVKGWNWKIHMYIVKSR